MIPDILFHSVLAGYSGESKEAIQIAWECIQREGLKPQIATAYSDLVPAGIRHLPIVWLGLLSEKSHSISGCILKVETAYLSKESLYPLNLSDVDWWVYEGQIMPAAISLHSFRWVSEG